MVIFLKLSVSGNAILNEATRMSLTTDIFARISFKIGRFEWLEKL